jgi:hypothetical protein
MQNLVSGRPITFFFILFLASSCVLLALKVSNRPPLVSSEGSLIQADHPGQNGSNGISAPSQGNSISGPLLGLRPLEYNVLLIGNAILLLATLTSFYFYQRALRNNQVHGFLRAVYSGMLLKMTICMAAAFLYVLLARHSVNKISILGCFGLYLVYTFAEVNILMQRSKQPKDA